MLKAEFSHISEGGVLLKNNTRKNIRQLFLVIGKVDRVVEKKERAPARCRTFDLDGSTKMTPGEKSKTTTGARHHRCAQLHHVGTRGKKNQRAALHLFLLLLQQLVCNFGSGRCTGGFRYATKDAMFVLVGKSKFLDGRSFRLDLLSILM